MIVRIAFLISLLGVVGALAAVAVVRDADGQVPPGPVSTTGGDTTVGVPTTEPVATAPADAEPAPPTGPSAAVRWRSRARGIAVSRPAGWHLRTDGRDFGNPGLCFELTSEPRPRAVDLRGSRAPRDGVEIRVVESFGGKGGASVRRPFALDRLAPPGATWTSGELYALRVHGRSIFVGIALGPDAGADVAAEVERLVRSLALSRSGRCLPPAATEIRWRTSKPLGLPYGGRLVRGVQLPAEGHHFFTWDPVLRRSPDRPRRRWGAAGVVRRTLAIVNAFAAAHPQAPRVGIGDLSLEHGGPFGPKHASHQNGLDVDVYYPRKDARERPPRTIAQVDRRLAQDLVNRFVAAGASKVFVGPNVRLTGPPGIVERLWNHDNHLHARFPSRRG